MTDSLQRYDFILIAILLSSSYAVSHLVESAYFGVWMILMALSVCLWLFREGLMNIGKVIWMQLPYKEEEKETEESDENNGAKEG